MKKSNLFILLIFAAMLAGCSLWPVSGDPAKKFTLSYTTHKVDVNPMKIQLLVDTPNVYPPLDTPRIALKSSERSIDYYADGEWSNRLGSLIQESIIYSLQNTGLLASVSRPSEGIKVDKVLKIEVRGFDVDTYSEPPNKVAHVDYFVQIAEMPTRRIVTSQSFKAKAYAKEERLESYVQALNQAHLEATQKMMDWALKIMPKAVETTDEKEADEDEDKPKKKKKSSKDEDDEDEDID